MDDGELRPLDLEVDDRHANGGRAHVDSGDPHLVATRPSGRSRDDGQLEVEQLGDLAQSADLVTDPERNVVRGPLGAPVVEERGRIA